MEKQTNQPRQPITEPQNKKTETVTPGISFANLTPKRIKLINTVGTPDQIKALQEYLAKASSPDEDRRTQDQKDYSGQFREAAPEKKVDHFRGILSQMKTRRTSPKRRPEELSLKEVRRWLWWAYAQIVKEETGIDLIKKLEQGKQVLTDPQSSSLKAIAYWLLGDPGGPWPIDKSLIFMGPKGTGKTTVIQAAEAVMVYIKSLYGWDSRSFELASFEQIFLNFKASESLSGLKPISTGWWAFDDLKARHSQYKHYGETLPLLSLILLARYSAWKLKGDQTIIATNLTTDEIQKLPEIEYDKLTVQYTVVPFPGENMRHPKHRII